ncbi:MAG: hypothetical protein A2287_04055 [Candidatus Melainabacteria bacterium RIFOXYA12_FULL_32_12]|nr:MAG: hypothetical protein A2287_04055 [Candidatus Melainabacteria bacterium RIFOXYA12_FULL_32_12]
MINDLTGILFGSVLLSSIHVLIPIHWLPIITIGKTERWSNSQTLLATLIIAGFHILSTVLIGLCVGFLGYKLSLFYEAYAKIIAASILGIIGLYYLFSEILHKFGHFHLFDHDHGGHDIFDAYNPYAEKKYNAIIISLAISSFLTPCIELEGYYFSVGMFGWHGILLVSAIYTIITVVLTVLLVYYSLKGRNKIKLEFLEKYEHQIVGMIMVLIGISIYFFE